MNKKTYEAAWAKRDKATSEFKTQLFNDIETARALPLGQQMAAARKACDKYYDSCKPAVEEWQKDLGIYEEEV